MTSPNDPTPASKAAQATVPEQHPAQGGHLQESIGEATVSPQPATDSVGSSGHIPQREEIHPAAGSDTGSPGADADSQADRQGD